MGHWWGTTRKQSRKLHSDTGINPTPQVFAKQPAGDTANFSKNGLPGAQFYL